MMSWTTDDMIRLPFCDVDKVSIACVQCDQRPLSVHFISFDPVYTQYTYLNNLVRPTRCVCIGCSLGGVGLL